MADALPVFDCPECLKRDERRKLRPQSSTLNVATDWVCDKCGAEYSYDIEAKRLTKKP